MQSIEFLYDKRLMAFNIVNNCRAHWQTVFKTFVEQLSNQTKHYMIRIRAIALENTRSSLTYELQMFIQTYAPVAGGFEPHRGVLQHSDPARAFIRRNAQIDATQGCCCCCLAKKTLVASAAMMSLAAQHSCANAA